MKAMDDRQFDGIMKQKLEAFQDGTPWEVSEMAHVLDQVDGLYPDPSWLVKVKSLLFPGGLAVLLLSIISFSNFWLKKPEIAVIPASPIVIETVPIPDVVNKEPEVNAKKPVPVVIAAKSINRESNSPKLEVQFPQPIEVKAVEVFEITPVEVAPPPPILVSRQVADIPVPKVANPSIPVYCVPLYRGERLRKPKHSRQTDELNSERMNQLQKRNFTPSTLGGSARGFNGSRMGGRRR